MPTRQKRIRPTPVGVAARAADSISTELDRVQTELARVRTALDHQERLVTLGTIAGLIAHEVNNILTPVHSYAQMALDAADDPVLARKALERALAGSEHASRIAGAILGFVRDDTDRCAESDSSACSTWNSRPATRIAHALDESLACIGRDPARDGIDLERDIPPDLTAHIRPIALQHVLMNLILNARQAMLADCPSPDPHTPRPRRGGTLSIAAFLANRAPEVGPDEVCSNPEVLRAASPTTSRNGWVVVDVRDTGRGLKTEHLRAMFDPFFTLGGESNPGNSRRAGTGLGLTVCTRLLAEAGGCLIASSELGRGTRMRIALPSALSVNT